MKIKAKAIYEFDLDPMVEMAHTAKSITEPGGIEIQIEIQAKFANGRGTIFLDSVDDLQELLKTFVEKEKEERAKGKAE